MKIDFDRLNEEKQMLERKLQSSGTENDLQKASVFANYNSIFYNEISYNF